MTEPPSTDRDVAARCVVIVPVASRIEPGCDSALRELERRGHPVWRIFGYSAIDLARCQLASDAVRAGYEHLMWVDADVVFDPDDVGRLLAHDVPLVAGLYAKKGHRSFAARYLDDTSTVHFGRRGGLIEMAGVGFGFVLTHRCVYERVEQYHRLPSCSPSDANPLVPYFMPMVSSRTGEPLYLPEDLAFCERARLAGVDVLADTRIRLWHVGPYSYAWEDAGRDVERYGDYEFRLR